MNLAGQLVEQLTNPALTPDERARLSCQLAKELEESGDYEGARWAMGELWRRVSSWTEKVLRDRPEQYGAV